MVTVQPQLPLELMEVDVLENKNVKKEKEDSSKDFVQQLSVAPADTNLAFQLASWWTRLGIKQVVARRLLIDVIAKDPENVSARFELGLSFYLSGGFDEAMVQFQAAFKLSGQTMIQALSYYRNASCLSLLFKHAFAEFEAGKNEKAVQILSLVAMIDPENPSVVTKAKEVMNYWLIVKPGGENQVLSKVEALIKLDRLDEAAKKMPDYQNSARWWSLKALLSYKRAELVKASFYARKALELNPQMTKVAAIAKKADKMLDYLREASKQTKLQRFDHAISLLTAALRVDRFNLRTSQVIYSQRAVAFLGAGKEEKALVDYHKLEYLQRKTGWAVVEKPIKIENMD